MGDNNLITVDTRYGNTFTLLDTINDVNISNLLETFYVPEVKVSDDSTKNIFIRTDANIAISEAGPQSIRFIYMNERGENVTEPDNTYVQVGNTCKGFLARISMPKMNKTYSAINLDYLVDISKIHYWPDKVFSAVKNPETGLTEMNTTTILRFHNIEFPEYSHLNWDSDIIEFSINKEKIFDKYF